MMVLLLMMMTTFISAGPLPAPSQHSGPDELNSKSHHMFSKDNTNSTKNYHLFQNDETNFTRTDAHQYVNETQDARNNMTTNRTTFIRFSLHLGCRISLCTLAHLSDSLQSGGDEQAGGASSDPFGPGK
ncbi:hypothetical protein ILYODFUR_001922 [Ilyodon furcidens]|uniref:Uncharacterized protein n=1 Tax=Ilyodon furcidens TaxID=33524 RepID=A0ABV0TR41_9TELE